MLIVFNQILAEATVLVEERRQGVLDVVSQRGFVALADLAQTIQVSPPTIRRDLDYWHQQGALRRTHGGAMFVADSATLPALDERSAVQLEDKRAGAHAAAAPACDTGTEVRDRGTTT